MLNTDLPVNIQALKLREQRNNLGKHKSGITQLVGIPGLAEYLIACIRNGMQHISKKTEISLSSDHTLKLDNSIYVLKDQTDNPRAFMLGELLGETNKSKVKYAYDLITGEEVAFKRVKEGSNLEKRLQSSIKSERIREKSALIQFNYFRADDIVLSHNNEKYCLATELMSGSDVDKVLTLISKRVKDEDELGEQFSAIIEMAHLFCLTVQQFQETGYLHRDIKPSNMMMHKDETGKHLKLIDFGGTIKESEIEQDQDNDYGDPEYLAPEILLSIKHSRASDAYSTGKSLDEMLQALNAVAFRSFHYPYEKTSLAIKDSLSDIVAGLTNKDPLQRLTLNQALQSFKEMAEIDPEVFSLNEDLISQTKKMSV